MWNELAKSLDISSNNHKRNYLYDCLNTSYYLSKALSEVDDYLNNFRCPKKSMEFYANSVFIHSLGYYSENPELSLEEKKNIENLKNLGFAYHKIDSLLCKNSISPDDARVKMKSILETMVKGMDFVFTTEIEKWGIFERIISVSDKKSYISNLIGDKKDSKIEYMVNFLSNKIN